jgi:hypothetical protein
MAIIREREYTFVTNNRVDFLRLHANEPLHAGVIVIVPNVPPADQRTLFSAALKHIATRDLANTIVEARYAGNQITCSQYLLPESSE